jgi:hypothetical protein
MANKDSGLIEACISGETKKLFERVTCDHPLDKDVLQLLAKLYTAIKDADEYAIFRHPKTTDALWRLLLEKAIKCLRYFDKREPFVGNPEKKPQVYGLDELYDYYKHYKEFEQMLYGSSQYYRDHVVHVIRTWLSGIRCLIRDNGRYLASISIQDAADITFESVERVSIWTIIALTHDLGYPLEQAKEIIEKTQGMVSTFVANPDISIDLSFHGVQNYMNDFIVRLMSSKMVDASVKDTEGNIVEEKYVTRLQPKYYFKFLKSLEKTRHGIVSTLIIYKLLTYFLESDYNINEDYYFTPDDRRQFYIRREILRAIASHTCTDVYHLYMGSFAFLLIIADDMQEWGRKYISELYVPAAITHSRNDIFLTVSGNTQKSPHQCRLSESVTVDKYDGWKAVVALLNRLREQALVYVTIFRDGQDTCKRDFLFIREFSIKYDTDESITFDMKLKISNQDASVFTGIITYSPDGTKNKDFGKDFIKELKNRAGADVNWRVFDASDNEIKKPLAANSGKWQSGTIAIKLTTQYE